MKRSLPLNEVYHLLEPGPVVLLTTAYKDRLNVMAMSWYTMLQTERPILACVIRENNYSFNFLKATKECVLNIPTETLAEKVVACGTVSGRTTDKFKTFQLSTTELASEVKSPLIDECFANLECKVIDMKMVPQYNLFVLEVIHAQVDDSQKSPATLHHQGQGEFMVAGKTIKIPFNHEDF